MPSQTFSRQVELPVSPQQAFAWHARPGALERLIPPWESVEIINRSGTLAEGATVELVNRMGPLRLRWLAEHYDFVPGEQFCDVQREGPFAEWNHTHLFQPNGSEHSCVLEDRISYRMPGGWLGRWLGGRWARRKISRMFDYRHETTSADLAAHSKHMEKASMKVAITGSRGLVGSELIPLLTTGGHSVARLVRGEPDAEEVQWDPEADSFDAAPLEGVDAVVHLAGENIGAGRWNEAVKQRIRHSRAHGTRVLCEGLAKMSTKPKVLVCASATGYYGDRGDEVLDESSDPGEGFLSEVCQEWEAATRPVEEAGIRVVNLRFGVILSPKAGALNKLLLPFKLGGGGIVGNGKQYWSWISIDDAAGVIHHAIMTDSVRGPVNAVVPDPATNHEFTKALGKVLRRPTIVPLPKFGARLMIGEMADALLLASARVEPKQLIATGYRFRHDNLEEAFRHLLGK